MIRLFNGKPIFLILFIFICLNAGAQSLQWKDELAKIPGKTDRVEFLLKQGKKLSYKQPSFEPLELAMQLATETGTDTLVAKANHELGKYYELSGQLETAAEYFRVARILFLKEKQYNAITSLMYWESKILIETNKPDSLIRLLDKYAPIVRLSNDVVQKLKVELMYANAHMMLNHSAEARQAFLKLIPKAESIRDTGLIISTYMNIAYMETSFDSAITWYTHVLPLARLSNKSMYVELLSAIGWKYSQRDDAKKDSALYFYLEAEKYEAYMDKPLSRAMLYNKIGEYFYQKQENPLALPYFRKAFEYGKKTGREYAILTANMALIFIDLDKLDSAAYFRDLYEKQVSNSKDDYQLMLLYQVKAMYAKAASDSCSPEMMDNFEKAIGYAVKLQDTRHGISMLVTNVMNCLLKPAPSVHEKAVAAKVLQHCRALYDQVKADHKLVKFSTFLESYANLEELYGNKQQALELYKELVKIQNEISERKYTEGIDDALVKYKSNLKDAEIDLLNEKGKAASVRTNFILAGMFGLALIIVLIFVLYRRENKNKKDLDLRNKKVENLLREIHHRVKNNLQIVSSFINIQMDKVKDAESLQSLMDTSRRIMALAGLHHSLYRQDDFSHIRLDEYITELCGNIKNTMQLRHDVELVYDLKKLELDMDKAIPIGLAVNELVTNALKYAFDESHQDPRITISLHGQDGSWELVIKDNGKGLPDQMDLTQKKSIGLRLVQNLVQRQVKGTFTQYNENGAVFKIAFMLKGTLDA